MTVKIRFFLFLNSILRVNDPKFPSKQKLAMLAIQTKTMMVFHTWIALVAHPSTKIKPIVISKPCLASTKTMTMVNLMLSLVQLMSIYCNIMARTQSPEDTKRCWRGSRVRYEVTLDSNNNSSSISRLSSKSWNLVREIMSTPN